MFGACDPKQSTEATEAPPLVAEPTPSENIQQIDPLEIVHDSILGILLSYYADLASEQLADGAYFAAKVKKFYKQTDQSREVIIKSVRNTFKTIEKRKITLDQSSLKVEKTSDGFQAEFVGAVEFVRTSDKSTVQERFRNRVGFDRNFRIISYEALELDRPTVARKLNLAAKDEIFVTEMLAALSSKKSDAMTPFIHPEEGFYYITRPGAMSMVTICKHIDEVYDNPLTPSVRGRLQSIACELAVESLPDFDCDKFSKTGCYMDATENYSGVSDLMKSLNAADLGAYEDVDFSQAQKMETYISRKAVFTNALLAMYFGEIEGKWYLLIIDIASYDCSA